MKIVKISKCPSDVAAKANKKTEYILFEKNVPEYEIMMKNGSF